jgi:hypothetical protein
MFDADEDAATMGPGESDGDGDGQPMERCVPADSAEYLEGTMPRYQGDGVMTIGGEEVNMNELTNPFDPTANDDDVANGDDSDAANTWSS